MARTAHIVGGDCWQLPLTGGGRPTAVTHTGLAMDCRASRGRLVYFEHIDPSLRPLPPDGVLDDPWEVRTKSLTDPGDGRLVSRGYLQGAAPVLGDGFVAWLSQRGRTPVTVQGRRPGKPVRVASPGAPGTLGAHGRTLVYSEQGVRGRRPVVLHFLTVS